MENCFLLELVFILFYILFSKICNIGVMGECKFLSKLVVIIFFRFVFIVILYLVWCLGVVVIFFIILFIFFVLSFLIKIEW